MLIESLARPGFDSRGVWGAALRTVNKLYIWSSKHWALVLGCPCKLKKNLNNTGTVPIINLCYLPLSPCVTRDKYELLLLLKYNCVSSLSLGLQEAVSSLQRLLGSRGELWDWTRWAAQLVYRAPDSRIKTLGFDVSQYYGYKKV